MLEVPPFTSYGKILMSNPAFSYRLAFLLCVLALSTGWAPLALGAEEVAAASAEDIQFYEKEIRPLMARHCYECHSARTKDVKSGLRLDDRAAVLEGGDRGVLAIAGKPDESLFMEALRFEQDDLQMPPAGKLSKRELAIFAEWIKRGMPMPEGNAEVATGIDWDKAREFWSFRPVEQPALPPVTDRDWAENRLDVFVLAELEAHQLSPSARADRRTLIRRATFDLTGLPPTPEEVLAFETDTAPGAYERLIDRLLASPRYGERWGRYWLDLARYTDQTASWLKSTGQAHLYRDWVVQAFNKDVPYADFVKRQLATDQIPETGPEDLPALGLIGLSPEYWKELQLPPDLISGIVAEEWEERIDAVGRTFLGLTLACARCHDHKFDPVTAEDYYALAGVFASVRLADRYMLPEDQAEVVAKAHTEVAALEKSLAALKKKKEPTDEEKAKLGELPKQIAKIKADTPQYDAPQANAVEDASIYVLPRGMNHTELKYKPGEARDIPLQIRGDPTKLGPEIPRRFITVLSPEGKPKTFQHGSGRLELAEAIVTDAKWLTARVMVNRVWSHHFGRGLVTTPSNFGFQGELPTHPALLEHLTAQFLQQGGSIKQLHRQMMLSAAYQQTSAVDSAKQAIDPDNMLLWRMNRRRLEIEAWRDSVLAATGQLNPTMGGPAIDLAATTNARRTIYGSVNRRDLNVMLRLFDFPDPTKHSPRRNETTTPLQQLFVLNSQFMLEQADALVARLIKEEGSDPETRIRRAYAVLFARAPLESEVQAGLAFINSAGDNASGWADYAQALLASNEFLFVD